jgi:hypothetical protein
VRRPPSLDGPSAEVDASTLLTAVPPSDTIPGRGPIRRALSFLRAHPVLCLLILTPGIPEYLSSSSPVYAIVLDPPQFTFQLAANLGLYGPGVLLIREAMIRWNKGWGSVLLLGAAYGILEEGIALSTLFNPEAGPVGQLGYYGHWLGVSWVWSAGILPVHMIFSISIPILLLGLALPATRGKSLLSRRGIRAVAAILAADVTFLFLVILLAEHFWMGTAVFLSSLAAMGGLVLLARRAPSGVPLATTRLPKARPRTMAILGAIFYPAVLLTEFVAIGEKVPASVDFFLVLLVQGLFLVCVLRVIGSTRNERQVIALAFGLIIPIAGIGLIATVAFPLVLVPDAAMVLFFVTLWRKYGGAGLGVPDPSRGAPAKVYPKI